ncbi:MAG: OmpH family outer membrane protein [Cyclobacteriaceae bacterium]
MKKLFLLVALAAGYFAHAQSPQTAENRVGYANMEYIITQLPDVKEIETEMKSTETQLRTQIQARSQEVQKQYTDFNENMKTMVDTVRINKQRDLEKAMADLEQMQQDAQVTLQNKQKLYMAPVYLKVTRAISEVAKENGYAIILTDKVSNYRLLLYQSTQLDVSNLVLEKFGVTPPAK